MDTYKIEQGNHSSGLHFAPFFYGCCVKGFFRLDESCLYSPEYSKDLNKLVGISGIYHHLNSVRLAWRSLAPNHLIQLFIYRYDKGKRTFTHIGDVQPGITYWYMLLRSGSCVVQGKHKEINHNTGGEARPYPLGYTLFPYFGGNKPAPHEMAINLSYNIF